MRGPAPTSLSVPELLLENRLSAQGGHRQALAKAGLVQAGSTICEDIKEGFAALAGGAGDCCGAALTFTGSPESCLRSVRASA